MVNDTVPKKSRPQPKGGSRKGKPNKTTAYEGLVAMAAQQAMANTGPFACALQVEIDAVHTVPASWSKKKRADALCGTMHPTTKPDIDNIAKAIADGGNGVAWVDDKQIARLVVVRRYGECPQAEYGGRGNWLPLLLTYEGLQIAPFTVALGERFMLGAVQWRVCEVMA